jgi:inward rectifier potassium channel
MIRKRNKNLKTETNTGFGDNSINNAARFLDRRTGKANVIKHGLGIFSRLSWYHTLLGMKTRRFILTIFIFYVLINLVFATMYYLVGIHHLNGIKFGTPLHDFLEVFFFSTQTFTTVGYGRIAPEGFAANAVSTFEAFIGLLSFAIATGLFYGRFSRPRAYLKFSHHALIAPFQEGTALMMRLAPYKNTSLSEAEARVTLFIEEEDNGKLKNQFYTLELDISKINTLPLSWTLVHPITDKSPFFGFTEEDFKKNHLEILVYIKAFDDGFSNNVIARFSYTGDEVVWGAKFKTMYYPNHHKTKVILNLNMLDEYNLVELPRMTAEAIINSGQAQG